MVDKVRLESGTFVLRCNKCGYETLIFGPTDVFYVGKEEENYCYKCREWGYGTIIREATMGDKLKPHMPLEGPPLPRGFFPAWPWRIIPPTMPTY